MPDNFPSYTNCSAPGDWYSEPIAQSALLALAGLLAGGAIEVFASALSPAIAVFSAGLCLGGIYFCSWWLNVRLICLGGDRGAIGVIYHLEPPDPGAPWDFGGYDTDYSFNLLLWPFKPQEELPASFVGQQWSPGAVASLQAEWPADFPGVPYSQVESQVGLIVPQQSMASLNQGFAGQDVQPADEPSPQPAAGSSQHFLIHCEIEGPGMRDFRTLLWVLFGVFLAAAAAYLIPVIGPAISAILAFLAWLAALIGGTAIQNDTASPPAGGGWGGVLNSYDNAANPDSFVDIAYVYGRWVYDSLHDGWNELHPLHYMIKIGETTQGNIATGAWPNLGFVLKRIDAQIAAINAPGAAQAQALPENRWTLHPLLDGCDGPTPYPGPPTPPVIH